MTWTITVFWKLVFIPILISVLAGWTLWETTRETLKGMGFHFRSPRRRRSLVMIYSKQKLRSKTSPRADLMRSETSWEARNVPNQRAEASRSAASSSIRNSSIVRKTNLWIRGLGRICITIALSWDKRKALWNSRWARNEHPPSCLRCRTWDSP